MAITRRQLLASVPVVAALALSGCGKSAPSDGHGTEDAQGASTLDLDGTWRQEGADDRQTYMEATIADGSITVLWVMDGGSSTAIYWQGTYVAPTGDPGTYSWTSETTIDPDAVNLMAAQAETKEFTYSDGRLSWQATALGVTTTVECERV